VADVSVMVRGIYTTALVKLLLDHGFKIAKPSATTAERFGLKDPPKEWDAVIRDYKPPKGSIAVEGPRAREVVGLLMESLPDVVVVSKKAGYEIYKGIVEKVDERGSYINYGEGMGLLPEKLVEGQEVIVSPIRNANSKGNRVALTKRVRIIGRYADLVKEGWVSTPKDAPPTTTSKLMNLGNLMRPPDWGVQWKREALTASMSELLEELQRLKEEALKLMQRAQESKAPCLVYEPPTRYVVMVPYESKKRLDELRGLVVTTMPNHHLIKSWGRKYAYAVDVVEKLMAFPPLGPGAGAMASNVITRSVVKEGARMAVEHVKPDGRVYELTPGVVEDFDVESATVTLRRRFKGGGVYDGLGVPKEEGDYGLSTYRLGSPISKTAYYDKGGTLKGIYVNISTPVEIAPKRVRYVDLEVDVVAKPNGEVRVLDLDKARELVNKGAITAKLYDAVVKVAERVRAMLIEKGDVDLDLKLF
jgi:Ribonuclease G/E